MVGRKENRNKVCSRLTACIGGAVSLCLLFIGYLLFENDSKKEISMDMETIKMVINKDKTTIYNKNCTGIGQCTTVWSAQEWERYKCFFKLCFHPNLEVKRQTRVTNPCDNKSENEYIVTFLPFKFHVRRRSIDTINENVINNVYYISNNDFIMILKNI